MVLKNYVVRGFGLNVTFATKKTLGISTNPYFRLEVLSITELF
ncbi:MAG: hypothetical protein ACI9F1_002653 [Colwellia sp.]